MKKEIAAAIKEAQKSMDFSGTIQVFRSDGTSTFSEGFSNRAEKLPNKDHTRFGIASGCKIFTAIAVCQLVEEGKLSLQDKLVEILDEPVPHFSKGITVHHLLTHTSGVPDYFDEEVMDDFEELWVNTPMYHIRQPVDFLPLFQEGQMKSTPGKEFQYNNSGYILLGVIVEKISGQLFSDYIEEHIFKKAGMEDSGYFAFDALPENTALGYIDLEDGTWKTNIYSLPAKGGPDGGAYTTVGDMTRFWSSLLNFNLLNEESTKNLMTPNAESSPGNFYGYGVWIQHKEEELFKYHVMGYDPGVSFHSSYYPKTASSLTVCSNASSGAYEMMKAIEAGLEL